MRESGNEDTIELLKLLCPEFPGLFSSVNTYKITALQYMFPQPCWSQIYDGVINSGMLHRAIP